MDKNYAYADSVEKKDSSNESRWFEEVGQIAKVINKE